MLRLKHIEMRAEVILFDRVISSPFSLRSNSNFCGNVNRNVNIAVEMKIERRLRFNNTGPCMASIL